MKQNMVTRQQCLEDGVPIPKANKQFDAGVFARIIEEHTKNWELEEGVYHPTGEVLHGKPKFKKMGCTDITLWFLPKASLPMALSVRDLRPVKPLTSDPRHGDPRLRDSALMWQTLVTHRKAALKDPDDY